MMLYRVLLVAALCAPSSCTKQEGQQIASAVATGAAVVAPLVCTSLSVAGQTQAGSVCGTVASDVGDVAQLVQKILVSLPASPPAARAPDGKFPVNGLSYRGVVITLPSGVDPGKVQAALQQAR